MSNNETLVELEKKSQFQIVKIFSRYDSEFQWINHKSASFSFFGETN